MWDRDTKQGCVTDNLPEFGSLNRSTEVRVNAFEEGDTKRTFRALKQIY